MSAMAVKVNEQADKQPDKTAKQGGKKPRKKKGKEPAKKANKLTDERAELSSWEAVNVSHYESERDDRWLEASHAQQYDYLGYLLAQISCGIELARHAGDSPLPAKLHAYQYFKLETRLKLPRDKLADMLGLSVKALERRILSETFERHETEALLRLYRLMVLVDEPDEPCHQTQNYERLGVWLLTPNESLEDLLPLELLDIEFGAVHVFRALLREEWVAEIEARAGEEAD